MSKSIKLMPTKSEAWDALGHVYWKKKDLEQAKKCFEGCLQQNEKDILAMRHLSMVLRQMQHKDIDSRLGAFKESIGLATKAVGLDLQDSMSWYILGNAHLTNFFANNQSIEELNKALKAYAQAEKHQKEANPDLFYNRATIYEYLERYNEAIRDYAVCHRTDPNMHADKKADKIVDFFIHASNQIKGKKSKKLSQMIKSVPSTLPGPVSFPTNEDPKKISYNIVNIS